MLELILDGNQGTQLKDEASLDELSQKVADGLSVKDESENDKSEWDSRYLSQRSGRSLNP